MALMSINERFFGKGLYGIKKMLFLELLIVLYNYI